MIEDGKKEDIGKKKNLKTAREMTQRPLKKTARVETLQLQIKTATVSTQGLFEENSQGGDPKNPK